MSPRWVSPQQGLAASWWILCLVAFRFQTSDEPILDARSWMTHEVEGHFFKPQFSSGADAKPCEHLPPFVELPVLSNALFAIVISPPSLRSSCSPPRRYGALLLCVLPPFSRHLILGPLEPLFGDPFEPQSAPPCRLSRAHPGLFITPIVLLGPVSTGSAFWFFCPLWPWLFSRSNQAPFPAVRTLSFPWSPTPSRPPTFSFFAGRGFFSFFLVLDFKNLFVRPRNLDFRFCAPPPLRFAGGLAQFPFGGRVVFSNPGDEWWALQ